MLAHSTSLHIAVLHTLRNAVLSRMVDNYYSDVLTTTSCNFTPKK